MSRVNDEGRRTQKDNISNRSNKASRQRMMDRMNHSESPTPKQQPNIAHSMLNTMKSEGIKEHEQSHWSDGKGA